MASQFRGDDFMPTQAQQQQQGQGRVPRTPSQAPPSQAPQTPAKPLGPLGLPINQSLFLDQVSLRSVTVKQLSDAVAAELPGADQNHPCLDGAPLSNFVLVGKLEEKAVGEAEWQVMIDDGTGCIEVGQELAPEAAAELDLEPLSDVHVGQYVRAHGMGALQVLAGWGTWRVLGHAVRPITDHNEVTHHFLRAILEHRHLLHKQAQAEAGSQLGGGRGPYPGPPLHQRMPGQGAPGQRQGRRMPGQGGGGGSQWEPSQWVPSQGGPRQGYGAPSQHLQTPS